MVYLCPEAPPNLVGKAMSVPSSGAFESGGLVLGLLALVSEFSPGMTL